MNYLLISSNNNDEIFLKGKLCASDMCKKILGNYILFPLYSYDEWEFLNFSNDNNYT